MANDGDQYNLPGKQIHMKIDLQDVWCNNQPFGDTTSSQIKELVSGYQVVEKEEKTMIFSALNHNYLFGKLLSNLRLAVSESSSALTKRNKTMKIKYAPLWQNSTGQVIDK